MAEPALSDEPFGRLLVDMQPRIRAFLRNLRRDAPVDDLVQETLTRAWRSRSSYDPDRGAPDAWLLRIAFHAYLDHRRPTLQFSDAAANEVASPAPGPADHASARERSAALLAELSPREREILLQFHRDGRSIVGIARSLGLPSGTVKSHLHRARARLWDLERNGGAE